MNKMAELNLWKIRKEQRKELLPKFNNKCNECKCCTDDNKFHIDHISPLAGGGINEECKLQVLCLSYHTDKCNSENEQGHYIRPKETTSFYNSEVRDIMDSDDKWSSSTACIRWKHLL